MNFKQVPLITENFFKKVHLSEHILKNIINMPEKDNSLKEHKIFAQYDFEQGVINSYKTEQACFFYEIKKALKINKQLSLVYNMSYNKFIEQIINTTHVFKKNLSNCDFVLLNTRFFYDTLYDQSKIELTAQDYSDIFNSTIINNFGNTEIITNKDVPYNLVMCLSNSCMIKEKKETKIITLEEKLCFIQHFNFKIQNLKEIVGFLFVDNIF